MKYQKLIFYTLIAGLVFFLQRSQSCKGESALGETVYVERTDTITMWLPSRIVTRTTVRYDTVHDHIVVREFQEVDTAGVLILFEEREDTGEMKLYEGIAQGDDGKCAYKYLVGISHDSLKLMAIETDCRRKVNEIIIESPLGYGDASDRSRLMIGAKMGMTLDKSMKTYGVQAAYRGLYASANYVPGVKGPVLEAGLLFPIGRKHKELFAEKDSLSIF